MGQIEYDAKQMLRTERNRCRHTVAWSPSREHWPSAVCRNTGSVMCAGEGTTTGTAPHPCAGVGEPPGRTQALPPGTDCPAPRNPPNHHAWCIGMTECRAGAPTGRRPRSTRLRNRLPGVVNRRAPPLLLSMRSESGVEVLPFSRSARAAGKLSSTRFRTDPRHRARSSFTAES